MRRLFICFGYASPESVVCGRRRPGRDGDHCGGNGRGGNGRGGNGRTTAEYSYQNSYLR